MAPMTDSTQLYVLRSISNHTIIYGDPAYTERIERLADDGYLEITELTKAMTVTEKGKEALRRKDE